MEEGQDFAGDMASWVNEENEESVRRALGWSSVQDVSNMGLAGCRLDWEDEEDNGFESPQAQPVQGQFILVLFSLSHIHI